MDDLTKCLAIQLCCYDDLLSGNAFWCHSYGIASEYIDFYENKHRFVKKSVYQRKYHLESVINDICSKNGWQISVQNHNRIHDIFQKIDKILPQINGDRKRMHINFILQKICEFLDLPTDKIKIKSEKTLLMYECYWNKVINLI